MTPTRQLHTASPQTEACFSGIAFVLIPAGTFLMGSEVGRGNEIPIHTVRITKPFYLGQYEVTQAQWEAVMGENPSYFTEVDRPVERVSWDEIQDFLGRLNSTASAYLAALLQDQLLPAACCGGKRAGFQYVLVVSCDEVSSG